MKQRTLWTAALAAALALTGCGSAGGSGSTDGSADGKLVVWDWKSSDANAAAFVAKAKADFARKHPKVTVEFVAQPFDQYYTLLGSAIQTGKGPDVMLFNGGGQLRDRADSLVPLDEYVAADRSRLAGWEAFSKNGKVYAAPITLQGHPIYYNKTLYEKAGLNPERPATTWGEFVGNCAAISRATGVKCLAMGNKEGYGIQFFMSSFGPGILTPQEYTDWIAGRRNWESPGVKKIFQLWKEAGDTGLNTDGANSTPMFMDMFGIFQGGRSAHVLGLMSDVGAWKDFNEYLTPQKVGVMLSPVVLPGTTPALGYDGGIGYGVAKWTKDPKLAAELVRSLASVAALKAYSTDAGAVAADTAVDASNGGPALAAILSKVTSGRPALHVALSAKTQDLMGRLSQSLLSGSVTVDDAVRQLAQSDAAG
jgi:ABC-type glycerol-3-phosphate transport system substrate-binding protein